MNEDQPRRTRRVLIAGTLGWGILGLLVMVPSWATAVTAGSTRTPTSTLWPAHQTSAAYETSIALTQDARLLTPSPTFDIRDLTPAPFTPDFSFSFFVHRLTDAGVIIWQGTSELFYVCFKEQMEDLPQIINEWRQTDGPRYPNIIVYAGAVRQGDSEGMVLVYEEFVTDKCGPLRYPTPFRDGAMEIVDAQGHRLLLRSEGGRYIYFDVDERRFETAVPTPTPTLTPTPPGGPQPPARLADYVLFADERVSISAWADVESGNVGVNDGPDGAKSLEASIGTGVEFGPGLTLSADSVKTANQVGFPDIIFANDLQTHPQTPFPGQLIQPLALPILALPPLPAFSIDPGAEDLVVAAPGLGGLPWGDTELDEFTIQRGATVVLGAGVHEFRRLILEPDSRLECAGDCELRIGEELRVGPRAYLGTSEVLPPAEGFIIYIAREDGRGFHSSPWSLVRALIYAPDSEILLGPLATFEGAFIGRSVQVMPYAVVRWMGGFGG